MEREKGKSGRGVLGSAEPEDLCGKSSVWTPSQPSPGPPGLASGLWVQDDEHHSGEGLEDVVLQVSSDEEVVAPGRSGSARPRLTPSRRTSAWYRLKIDH